MTRPDYGECWSVNVSSGGMAVTARLSSEAIPEEGTRLDLEFLIPDARSRIVTGGRVTWVGPSIFSRDRLAFGLTFVEMGATERALLARYLADYRPRVVLVRASASETKVCQRALERDAYAHRADTDDELNALLLRGDISVVVVFGSDESAGVRSVENIHSTFGARENRDPVGLEPVPRVVCCAAVSAPKLIKLYNEGKLYQSLPRPVEAEVLSATIRRASEDFAVRSELRRVSLELERAFLKEKGTAKPLAGAQSSAVKELIFESKVMGEVMNLIRVVAPHRAPVLLQGETGTGKELLARAIHELSSSASGPFVTLDCGTLTETLLESELFGHVAGAFTGATTDRPGLFQIADGGTLFLDEIENTTPLLQAKLLRVIESGEVRPVGGTKIVHVDVRLVAASNRELRGEVELKRFRSDLFYRLNSFPVDVPPLRQRREDILPLAKHYLQRFSESIHNAAGKLDNEAERALLAYSWPGNVRELRNAIERAVLLGDAKQPITLELLPPTLHQGTSLPTSTGNGAPLRQQVKEFEREVIRAALHAHRGVLRQAAKSLGMNPVTFGRKAKQHGLTVT